MSGKLDKTDKMLVSGASFTGLWALAWLGSSMMGAGATAQGAFGAGTVMGASGVTTMWWKMRALHQYQKEDPDAEPQQDDSHIGRAHKT